MLSLLSTLRFHAISAWRLHRLSCAAFALALTLSIAAAVAWLVATQEYERGRAELSLLSAVKKDDQSVEASISSLRGSQPAALPRFSSHEFATKFHEVAHGVNLPIDEVGYVLESETGKPYLRYKITMTVKTRYLDLRKFIASLSSEMPHVSLDAIQCGRESTTSLPLTCQLTLSAYFAKG